MTSFGVALTPGLGFVLVGAGILAGVGLTLGALYLLLRNVNVG